MRNITSFQLLRRGRVRGKIRAMEKRKEAEERKLTDEEILAKYAGERTKCTVYTRVMGYHRPVETFNDGKQGEFEERAHFLESTCGCGLR